MMEIIKNNRTIILGLLCIIGVLFIVGCQTQDQGGVPLTSEEKELTGEAALAGQASASLTCTTRTVMGGGTCTDTDNTGSIILTVGGRETPLYDGCKSGGRLYDYSCPSSTQYQWCITQCSSGCNSEKKLCNENVNRCGDGTVQAEEQCDDGNTANGDGCSGTCQAETTAACTEGTYQVTETNSCVQTCIGGTWRTTVCGPIPRLGCSSAGGSSDILSKDNLFYLNGTLFQYKGADKLSEATPRAKIKDLSTGETLEFSTNKEGKARFSLKNRGEQYDFANSSEAYSNDNYRIFRICS